MEKDQSVEAKFIPSKYNHKSPNSLPYTVIAKKKILIWDFNWGNFRFSIILNIRGNFKFLDSLNFYQG